MARHGESVINFHVFPGLPNATEVVARLGGPPPDELESYNEDQRGPSYHDRDTRLTWFALSDAEDMVPIQEQLARLLDRLEPLRLNLLDLEQACSQNGVACSFVFKSYVFVPFATVALLEIDHSVLERIGSFNAAFDIEYVWTEEAGPTRVDWELAPGRGFSDLYRTRYSVEGASE